MEFSRRARQEANVPSCPTCGHETRQWASKSERNLTCECPYADCKCKLCFLVEKRRQLNSQLHDLEVIELESTKRSDDDDQPPPSSHSDVDRMVRVKGGEQSISSEE
ncbi:hypothetical protein COOONC_04027 [Cooperia oncophora]